MAASKNLVVRTEEHPGIARLPRAALRRFAAAIDPADEREGARYRRRALLVLMAVLAVDYADRSLVGALAPQLKHAFGIGNTQIGLIASAFSVVGGVATIPAGVLTDRFKRTLVLAASLSLWTVAMATSGAAFSYTMLLVTRLFLGVVTATGRPTIASIVGDLYRPGIRGRALGVIDAGELIGNGVGLVLAASLGHWVGWRWTFWLLACVGAALVVVTWRLPEPERCGSMREERTHRSQTRDAAQQAVEEERVEPDERLVLRGDAHRMPLWSAIRYVLRVRTNVIVIVSSSVSFFFFAGISTFAVVFTVHQYGVSQATADVALLGVGGGALVGTIAGGRLGDRLLRGGHVNARLVLSAACYVGAALLFLPALLLGSLALALPLYFAGAALLGAPSAPLDAVRLDVIHPQLWGRAEGTRTLVKIAAEAVAPISFGVVADHFGGKSGGGAQVAFLVALPTLAVSGLILLVALRTYAREVASVMASVDAAPSGGR